MQSAHTATIGAEPPIAFTLNRLRLEQLRKAHGIDSEADLARVIGVNASTLHRVSTGKTLPSNEFMAKVKATFPAVAFEQLFTLTNLAPALDLKKTA